MAGADAVRTSRAVPSLPMSLPDNTDLVIAANACNIHTDLSLPSKTSSRPAAASQTHKAKSIEASPDATGATFRPH